MKITLKENQLGLIIKNRGNTEYYTKIVKCESDNTPQLFSISKGDSENELIVFAFDDEKIELFRTEINEDEIMDYFMERYHVSILEDSNVYINELEEYKINKKNEEKTSFMAFLKGGKVPKEILEIIDTRTDSLRLFTTSPMNAVISLKDISEDELEAFNGAFVVGYSLINKMPILTFTFSCMNFEAPIVSMEAVSKEENSLLLTLAERSDMIIQANRSLGLSHSIIERMIKDVAEVSKYSEAEQFKMMNEVQAKYSTTQIANLSIEKQIFAGIK
ncbi:hypothetical protein [Poseidonibacter ostreae]|uniref:Uncharacterized protein n=1 Tax=Poseidonibacter ostreae TaxID=2654171 RepID=A0A6L4WWG0_9BACT|nr:hypothetical protein [Poseidonibacter ostreae]KAB7891366.1 hypothetical protein GBG19_00590 [Poseidonibacter ostreae]